MRTRVRFRVWELNRPPIADEFDARSRRPAWLENLLAGLQSVRHFDSIRIGSRHPASFRFRSFKYQFASRCHHPTTEFQEFRPNSHATPAFEGGFADTPAGGQLFLIEVNDVHLGLLPHELAGVHEGAVRSASQVNSEDARLLREIVQLVAGTAPARIRFPQHAAREQVVDVAQRRVWRALGDRRPLAAGELTFKAIE